MQALRGSLLDRRWDGVPRLDLDALMNNCERVVLIDGPGERGWTEVGATLADLAARGHEIVTVSTADAASEQFGHRTLVIAPACWASDRASQLGEARLLEYLLTDDHVPWPRLRVLAPTLAGLRAKQSMLGERACVAEAVQVPAERYFASRIEGFVGTARARTEVAGPFDAMVEDGGDDPWHLDDSVYEVRRLELILSCLGRTHYGRVVEIGCATGQLSVALAKRADEVVAMDASPRALSVARTRPTPGDIRWTLGAAPLDFPDVAADLIVLSEVGYFLDGPDLLATLRTARNRLRDGGEIVLANWRRPTANIPLDGPTVQAQAGAMLDLPRRAHYEDVDLCIDIWGEPLSVYDEYSDRA